MKDKGKQINVGKTAKTSEKQLKRQKNRKTEKQLKRQKNS